MNKLEGIVHKMGQLAMLAWICALVACLILASSGIMLPASAHGANVELAAGTAAHAASEHVVVRAQSVANAKGKAAMGKLFRFGWSNGAYRAFAPKKSSAYDVTGDGLADVICVGAPAGKTDGGLVSQVVITVNGETAYTIEGGQALIDQAAVDVVTLKNGTPFVFVSAYRDDGSACQALLQWRGGVLAEVVTNGLLAGQGVFDSSISSVRPTGNRVIVQFEFSSTVTGSTRASFAYAWKDGELARTHDETTALRYATTGKGGYTKLARTSAQSLAVYSTASLAKKSFVIPAKKSVRILALRLVGNDVSYKVRYAKRTGWIGCLAPGSYENGKAFRNVYGAGPLKQVPRAYSAKKKLKASVLLSFGNHALYLMRNEVFARHGQVFATDELRAYFGQMPWYAPNARKTVSLGKTEAENVALIRLVEKGRKSPYVS